jgi:hypothetical protein
MDCKGDIAGTNFDSSWPRDLTVTSYRVIDRLAGVVKFNCSKVFQWNSIKDCVDDL